MRQSDPPKPDELELSLFGPGFGECAIVHLGAGRWLVVDSCFDRAVGRPVALRYFEQLGIDVSKDVCQVVVTHWHDDHIRGAATIVGEAQRAAFVCSAALKKEEFFVLLAAARREVKLVDHSSGMAEFSRILQLLRDREGRSSPHRWASDGTILFEDPTTGVEVRALSPSAETIANATTALANLLPNPGDPIKRITERSPNDLSIVLQVRAPNFSFLLGGDLETGRSPHRGWHAVVNDGAHSNLRSIGFKVSHHGSHNGDHPEIWSRLLLDPAFALLTPYGRGRKPLPAPSDVARMRAKTSHLFSTIWPPTLKPKFHDKAVKRTVDEVLNGARTTRARPGHVRLRIPLNGAAEPQLELFDGAVDCISLDPSG